MYFDAYESLVSALASRWNHFFPGYSRAETSNSKEPAANLFPANPTSLYSDWPFDLETAQSFHAITQGPTNRALRDFENFYKTSRPAAKLGLLRKWLGRIIVPASIAISLVCIIFIYTRMTPKTNDRPGGIDNKSESTNYKLEDTENKPVGTESKPEGTDIILLVIAAIGSFIGGLFALAESTRKVLDHTRENINSDGFKNAMIWLTSDTETDRIRGLYRLCSTSEELSGSLDAILFNILGLIRKNCSSIIAGEIRDDQATSGPQRDTQIDTVISLLLIGRSPLNGALSLGNLETNLCAIYLKSVYLSNFTYLNIDFSRSRFERSIFTSGEFVRCRFSDSCWTDLVIISCELQGAVGSETEFIRNELYSVDLSNASLAKSTWTDCRIAPLSIDSQSSLLRETDFTKATITQTRFVSLILEETRFKKTTFQSTNFVGCTLIKVDFSSATMGDTHFLCCEIIDCNFSESTFGAVNFSGSKLYRSCFRRALGLSHHNFSRSRLDDRTFRSLDKETRTHLFYTDPNTPPPPRSFTGIADQHLNTQQASEPWESFLEWLLPFVVTQSELSERRRSKLKFRNLRPWKN